MSSIEGLATEIKVYVSSSVGNDSNTGVSPTFPLRSISLA